ncbi:hypothetical protein QBC45DRAFT_485207 [Copromyces sp. CBS 386.78]|nr:hypothetical protein QBC45DRAFT_485207 [Copromyces sp. CBS 386.78]
MTPIPSETFSLFSGIEDEQETISSKSRSIRQRLTDLVKTLEADSSPVSTSVSPLSLKDVSERFMLWAGNLGALHKPTAKLSLDARLASSEDLRDFIYGQLDDMTEALADLGSIIDGSVPNRDLDSSFDFDNESESESELESDDEPLVEAHSILQVVLQCLTSLFRVGILIRQSASSATDRFQRATRGSVPPFTKADMNHVREKFPKLWFNESSPVAERMGKAITKRRQFMWYCRDHQSHLAADGGDEKSIVDNHRDDNHRDIVEYDKAKTAKQSSKATTFFPKDNLMDVLQKSLDGKEEEEEESVSQYSTSTVSDSLANLKLPPLSGLSPDSKPFECPICYTLQQFRSERAWQYHAYRDLKAYVCTVGGSECDDMLFGDRTSWFNHELEQHRCGYTCLLCGPGQGQTKMTATQLRTHILAKHGKFERDQLDHFADAGREIITHIKAKDCPFCDEWTDRILKRADHRHTTNSPDEVNIRRFRKHVATHLEQLAIFALGPREVDEDEVSGPGSRSASSTGSAISSSGLPRYNESVISLSNPEGRPKSSQPPPHGAIAGTFPEAEAMYERAAENGHEAVIKLLLDTGKVDADPKDRDGRAALCQLA